MILEELLAGLGFAVERIPGQQRGDHLLARHDNGSGPQLLLGHLDTVWLDGNARADAGRGP
ncbi:MAG: hypothetical protein R2691_00625 [Solirubrobacterales bacterium]